MMQVYQKISSDSILEKGKLQYDNKLPFVIYNKPNSENLIGIFQQNNDLNLVVDYSETGFVFAPFDGKEIVLIPENQSEIYISNFQVGELITKSNTSFEPIGEESIIKFEALVQKGIDSIKEGGLKKVVLSRKEKVKLEQFNLYSTILNLLYSYPTAFTYCFYHPKVGLWLGAFSEQLLKKKAFSFYTMSVAGTQKIEGNKPVVWEDKEKQEQQIVTDFISDNLKNYASEIVISLPYTLKAGTVVHIKTDIQGILNSDTNLEQIVKILHPTPAVCGLPKEKARDFILEQEGYDREYYAGFLGELNKDFINLENNTDFFVNLRCMKIDKNPNSDLLQAHLFVGGGITKDSIPQKEWQETVNKSETIIKVLS
jgi:isochorismate synthase